MKKHLLSIGIALLVGSWQASFCLAAAVHFFTPGSWSVGDANTTYQEWDVFSGTTGNTPDVGLTVNPAISSSPTLTANPPAILTGTNNFYSFASNYHIEADIFNHGGSSGSVSYPSGFGTHVIVQTAASMNLEPNDGGPASVLLNSLQVVKHNGDPITGGANGDALQESEIWSGVVSSSFGDVTQQELIWEFWLPGHTDDFRVEWNEIIHSSFFQLRVDSMVAEAPSNITTTPEPSSFLLMGAGAIVVAFAAWRKRRV